MQKWSIFTYFTKILQNRSLDFRALDEKHNWLGKFCKSLVKFWWKFNRKIEFLSILGNLVATNRAFGNTIIFLQQFFRFGGLKPLTPPPAYATIAVHPIAFPFFYLTCAACHFLHFPCLYVKLNLGKINLVG